MRRFLLAAIVAVSLLPGCGHAAGEAQTLVDRATLAVQEMMTQTVSHDPLVMLQRSRAVMICPRIFKAGFFFGGSGGACVLLARAGNGTWSYPAFYTIGSGSFGFQFGIEDSQLVMMIMTQRGLNAVMDSQFKLGADASVAVATVGGTVGGATTTAVGADIVAFAETRGLFGGVSLEGSIMALDSGRIAGYYGQPYAARQIVIQMQASNPGADPLREVLTRYGTRNTMPASMAPALPPMSGPAPADRRPGYAPAYPPVNQGNNQPANPGYGQPAGQGYAPPASQGYGNPPANQGYGAPPTSQGYGGQPVQLQPNAPVQQQSLPPPGR